MPLVLSLTHPTRPHPPWSGLGLECTGACPCFSFSDREINFPLRSQGVCCSSPGGEGEMGAPLLCFPGAPAGGPGARCSHHCLWLVEVPGQEEAARSSADSFCEGLHRPCSRLCRPLLSSSWERRSQSRQGCTWGPDTGHDLQYPLCVHPRKDPC